MLDKFLDAMVAYETMRDTYEEAMSDEGFKQETVDTFIMASVDLIRQDLVQMIIAADTDELVQVIKELKEQVKPNDVQ